MIFSYPFILDVILIVSLMVTILCCMILYRKLREIKKSESEIKQVISQFTFATERANTSLLSLRKSGSDLTAFMQEKISEAKSTIDDLKFLNEQARKISKKPKNKSTYSEYKGNEKNISNNVKISDIKVPLRSEMEKELLTALEQSR